MKAGKIWKSPQKIRKKRRRRHSFCKLPQLPVISWALPIFVCPLAGLATQLIVHTFDEAAFVPLPCIAGPLFHRSFFPCGLLARRASCASSLVVLPSPLPFPLCNPPPLPRSFLVSFQRVPFRPFAARPRGCGVLRGKFRSLPRGRRLELRFGSSRRRDYRRQRRGEHRTLLLR